MQRNTVILGALLCITAISVVIASYVTLSTERYSAEISQNTPISSGVHDDDDSQGLLPKMKENALKDPNGPWNRDLFVMRADSIEGFADQNGTIAIQAAGVPSVILQPDGSLLATFQWFPTGNDAAFDRIAVASSLDNGKTWAEPTTIILKDYPRNTTRPYDPTIVRTEDGKIRMYFTVEDSKRIGSIHSALSLDGITYTYEGEVYARAGERVFDATVTQLASGTWMLAVPYVPQKGIHTATSTDGVTFTAQSDYVSDAQVNWTGNLFTDTDSVTYFVGGESPMKKSLWFTKTTNGTTWSEPVLLNETAGDVALVRTADDALLVLYVGAQH